MRTDTLLHEPGLRPSQPRPHDAPEREQPERERGERSRSGFALGRLFGIEVRVDWSLSFIFALIALDLGAGVFPRWHPDWSVALCWGVALTAALLFFASVLAHELSHALVARARGIAVPRITLFLFGGVAELAEEPRTPGSEFLIAIVGPLTSLAIGAGALVATGLLAGPLLPDMSSALESSSLLEQLGPLPTLLLWLGPVNVTLGLFNLIPGFPLDGGRVLRSALWKITGDAAKATRWAARSGQLVAVFMMVGGGMIALGGNAMQGVWLALLGWFLYRAASSSLGSGPESPRTPEPPRPAHGTRYELPPDDRRSNA
jgi:Zn-dependent protease